MARYGRPSSPQRSRGGGRYGDRERGGGDRGRRR